MSANDVEAAFLLNHPILNAIFSQMERSAIEIAVSAKMGDDELRRSALGEVRAIRSVRQKLDLIAKGRANLPDDTGA